MSRTIKAIERHMIPRPTIPPVAITDRLSSDFSPAIQNSSLNGSAGWKRSQDLHNESCVWSSRLRNQPNSQQLTGKQL